MFRITNSLGPLVLAQRLTGVTVVKLANQAYYTRIILQAPAGLRSRELYKAEARVGMRGLC